MRPRRLQVEGFLSYRAPLDLDLSTIRAAAIVGENGTGKTSLVEAMAWALFGRGRAGPDGMVNALATNARVRFDFDLGAETYRVERSRTRGKAAKSYLGLFVRVEHDEPMLERDWTPIGGDSIRETQAAIERLLGMSAETWLATAFVAQGRADAFTALGPADRKSLLFDLLQLEHYVAIGGRAASRRALALEEANRARGAVAARRAELASCENAREMAAAATQRRELTTRDLSAEREGRRLAGEQVAIATSALARLEQARETSDERRREAQETARELRRRESEHQHALEGLTRVRQRIETLEAQTIELDRNEHEHSRLELDASESGARLRALEGEQASARAKLVELSRRASQLESDRKALRGAGATCPICGENLDGPGRREQAEARFDDELKHARIEDGLTRTAMEETRERATRETEKLGALESRLAELAARRVELARVVGEVEALRGERIRLEVEIPLAESRLDETRRRARAASLRASEVDDASESALADARRDVAAADRDLADRSARVDELERELQLATLEEGRAREALRRRDELVELIERDETTLQERLGESDDWGVVARAFGRDGIPALVLETEIVELERESSSMLDRLTAGRWTLRLETTRALKGGGEAETLEVTVGDATAERSLDSLSGGERQCVDLALRAGLSRLLAARAGRAIDTLIVDEGFTALDVAHRQRTIEALHGLAERFGCLLFVTHMTEMADAFPQRVVVSRDDAGSRAEVVQ